MKSRLLVGSLGAGLLVAGLAAAETPRKNPAADNDMRQAIAFERYKDVAAARQAQKEARHPTVSYSNADRSADRSADQPAGRPVKDPGPPPKRTTTNRISAGGLEQTGPPAGPTQPASISVHENTL